MCTVVILRKPKFSSTTLIRTSLCRQEKIARRNDEIMRDAVARVAASKPCS